MSGRPLDKMVHFAGYIATLTDHGLNVL